TQEIGALNQLHREETVLFVRDQLVQRHEVGVWPPDKSTKLLFEPIQGRRVDPVHGLQSDDSLAPAIPGPVHDPHTALAQLLQDLGAWSVRRSPGGKSATPGLRKTHERWDRIHADQSLQLRELRGEASTVVRQGRSITRLLPNAVFLVDEARLQRARRT